MQEIFDAEVPGWRGQGVWSEPNVVCSLCKSVTSAPDPVKMFAVVDQDGVPSFLCKQCALPLRARAQATLGLFMESSPSSSTE